MKGRNAPPTPHKLNQPVPTFPPRRDYSSLSVQDLLEAREAYHVHLSSLENVIATGIGRYLIQEDDWYAQHPPDDPRPADGPRFPRRGTPRTLANSIVRPWSWPCVLVFVRRWEELDQVGPQAVPRTLYLPDGRVVPTCVVLAEPDETPLPPANPPPQVSVLLGGGYACLRRSQGSDNVGTFGCLVKRDGTYYALTSRHVAGGENQVVRASVHGEYHRVGRSTSQSVGRVLMSNVFRRWPGERTYLAFDAGLVRIKDVSDWTSQVWGIGEIGEEFDATEQSITLDLIGCPVRAFGAESGVMEGEILALFFRYQSLGGFDQATDVLIGPRRSKRTAQQLTPLTRPGDSGTLWFYDPPSRENVDSQEQDIPHSRVPRDRGKRARRLRPMAMQWGGQRVKLPNGRTSAFALGSFISTICRALDVQIVREWSTGHDEYWGKIGHFAVGWKACDQLSGNLGDLMKANQARIGFGNDELGKGAGFKQGRQGFVPLSDVPDYVWIANKGARPHEGIQHFADIDIYDIDGGPTLLARCYEDPSAISASVWKEYFDGFAAKGVGPEEGALPFRVWQIWEDMVAYLKKRDVTAFVAAAGVLAHYVGDASQPLHCSYMHHGMPPMTKIGRRSYPVPRDSEEFGEFKESREAKIHGIYEETMLEVDAPSALAAIDTELKGRRSKAKIESGHDAAAEVIRLMYEAQERLAPKAIFNADDPSLGPKARAQALWNKKNIREATITSLAESVRLLADLWQSAWDAGGGDKIAKSKLVELDEDDLDKIYRRDKTFVPSLSLDAMAQSGRFEPVAMPTAKKTAAKKKSAKRKTRPA